MSRSGSTAPTTIPQNSEQPGTRGELDRTQQRNGVEHVLSQGVTDGKRVVGIDEAHPGRKGNPRLRIARQVLRTAIVEVAIQAALRWRLGRVTDRLRRIDAMRRAGADAAIAMPNRVERNRGESSFGQRVCDEKERFLACRQSVLEHDDRPTCRWRSPLGYADEEGHIFGHIVLGWIGDKRTGCRVDRVPGRERTADPNANLQVFARLFRPRPTPHPGLFGTRLGTDDH